MERLVDKAALNFLRDIMRTRAQLNLKISKTDYSRLTIILEISVEKGRRCLVVDKTLDFEEAIRSKSNPILIFECKDANKIPFSFETTIYKLALDSIWVHFPHEVNRIQKRRFFRIDVPLGCKLKAEARGTPVSFGVQDISMGGACIVAPLSGSAMELLKKADKLEKIELHMTIDKEVYVISVKSAVVKRFFSKKHDKAALCGLEFKEMDFQARTILQKYLGSLQRHALKKSTL